MKFFPSAKLETASKDELIKRWRDLLDIALEQSRDNLHLSRDIFKINLTFEDDDFIHLPGEMRHFYLAEGRKLERQHREQLKLGDEIYSQIKSEQIKIEQLLLSKYGVKVEDIQQTEEDSLKMGAS